MQKDPEFLKNKLTWTTLAPRSTDAIDLFQFIGGKPKRISGFCSICDSRISNDWFVAELKQSCEIRHLAEKDIGILRPSELAIIQEWLLTQER